jgi:excisionase family DNA binding protein
MNGADVLTVAEAAVALKVGPKTIRRLCRLKRIAHRVVDLRGTIRISRTALDQFIEGGAK